MVCPPNSSNSNDNSSDAGEKTAFLQESEQASLIKEIQKAKEQEACLIIIRGSPQGHRFFLSQPEMIIGRDPNCEISLSDVNVSKRHARIEKQDGKVTITDLGSTNGTAINDKKTTAGEAIKLAKEDMIKMGNSILKFLPAGELEILFYGNLGSAAHTDPLTKIYNRRYFLEAFEAEFKRAKALHKDFSLLYFDLDHFKKVNDSYGHEAGDYVLKEFTNIVRGGYLRPKDVFARVGGEEFVVLLFNTNAAQASELAEKIRVGVETHAFIYEEKRIPITTSMGIAELRADIESPQTLLKMADQALYSAKTSGRNKVMVSS
jgi:two-component system, cell cycle response regulator